MKYTPVFVRAKVHFDCTNDCFVLYLYQNYREMRACEPETNVGTIFFTRLRNWGQVEIRKIIYFATFKISRPYTLLYGNVLALRIDFARGERSITQPKCKSERFWMIGSSKLWLWGRLRLPHFLTLLGCWLGACLLHAGLHATEALIVTTFFVLSVHIDFGFATLFAQTDALTFAAVADKNVCNFDKRLQFSCPVTLIRTLCLSNHVGFPNWGSHYSHTHCFGCTGLPIELFFNTGL